MHRIKPFFVLIFCLGLIGAGSVTSGAATTGAPVTNGKIAFETRRDGNFEIYSMNPDGTEQTNLSNNDDDEFNPVWSPDGTKIAFMTDGFGPIEIYVMNADGSGQTRLTNNTANDVDPVWSPDGTKILFESDQGVASPDPEDPLFEIYIMNADGTGQTRLTNNTAADYDPVWSPDASKIAFQSQRDGNDEIYVMNVDGSGQTNVSNNAADDYDPEWSPDGTKIVFEARRDGNGELYVMNPDGTAQTRLTNNTAEDYLADCCYQRESWSPDGTKLTFLSNRDGNFEIYVMNADGSGQTRLTNNTSGDWDPSWSPDGTKIVFESERDFNTQEDEDSFELYVMNADGSEQTRLTNNTTGDFEPEWQAVPGEEPVPPDTTIVKGPKAKTTDRTPKFTFESNIAGSTFECKLDTKAFKACTSPKEYGRQKLGSHTFMVQATADGVTDPTPATMTWKVKRKPR